MDAHSNARRTPRGREDTVRAVVDGGLTKAETARRFSSSAKTVAKWLLASPHTALMACPTAHPDSIHRRAGHRPPPAMPSMSCTASAAHRRN